MECREVTICDPHYDVFVVVADDQVGIRLFSFRVRQLHTPKSGFFSAAEIDYWRFSYPILPIFVLFSFPKSCVQ
jgi:hypothetical protein